MSIAEQPLAIKRDDGLLIDGHLATCENSKGLIIIVHGLTGGQNEYQHLIARNLLPTLGYDVYRYNQYDPQPPRSLLTVTVEQHLLDLQTIVDYFKPKYKKLFAVGHSYGGLTITLANCQDLSAMSLWDPAFNMADFWPQAVISDKHGNRFVDWKDGSLIQVGDSLYEEGSTFTVEHMTKAAKAVTIPSQLVIAANTHIMEQVMYYPKTLDALQDTVTVEHADHCFRGLGQAEQVATATAKFFDRF